MGIQIGAKPDAGFDDPLGMLQDCHRRIEHFLNILVLVASRAMGRPLTEEEAGAVQASLQYFRVGGQRHTADEEESLFPRMREDAILAGLSEMAHLEQEHRVADSLHNEVDQLYSAWIANGTLGAEDAGRLTVATERLKQLYAAHIEMEEKVVFPRAAEVFSHETIAAIGQEFEARRR